MNHPASQPARPPLWLAAAAVATGWGAVYDIGRWIAAFVTFPAHEDVRIYYVAAQAGLRASAHLGCGLARDTRGQ